jgi:ABC-type nitrate/sulfonate/bicarbonate transport system ATPase subunit
MTAPASATQSGGLRLHGLAKTYASRAGEVTGLRPVSLAIPAGSLVAVVGRSGCGKTTLLRLLAGLLAPSGGFVEIDGQLVNGPPVETRTVFQDYAQSLLPWQTVAQNVGFGLRHAYLRDAATPDAEAVRAILAEIGLADAADRYPWELSGGMQQRVAIARALCARPRILLMDEPFSAVDALSRATLQDLVLRLWSRLGITIVLVTHDIEEAVYLADRVLVLAPGGAGIAADEMISLPRPRHQVETRESPEYLEHRRRLLRLVLD